MEMNLEVPLELTQKAARRGKWTYEVSSNITTCLCFPTICSHYEQFFAITLEHSTVQFLSNLVNLVYIRRRSIPSG